jgi:hypothetical protein
MTKSEELEIIAEKNGGILRPHDVVEFAKDPKTALHKSFEWDDSEAAKKYRITQAQQVIRCHVIQLESDHGPMTVRAYQSLPSMRGPDHEYVKTSACMSNDEWKSEMLKTALKELNAFREKYGILSSLAPLFEKIDELEKAS